MNNIFDRMITLKGSQKTAAFARSIGIPQQTMDRYLKGREPPIEVIKSLCMVYNVSSDWLLGLSASPAQAITNSPGAFIGSNNTVTHGADCENCKFKRLAEALKAVQAV